MTRELEYLKEALDEAEAAARWYAERSVTAAAAFSSEIDAAEAAIVRLPEALRSYGATVPDLPGCVAVGESLDEVQRLIRDAIDVHVAFLRDEGQPVPEPVTRVEYVEVAS